VNETAPVASVVVATFNRAALLDRLVDALRAQTGIESYEVVVVDDGSTDETPEVLRSLDQGWPALRSIRLDHNQGPAAARNAGWRHATGAIVAFTDDDCIPQPGWLAALVDNSDAADIVQGRTEGNPTQQRDGWFSWSPQTLEPNGTYETCNIAYRRQLLVDVGGFDESFRARVHKSRRRGGYVSPVWGEDTDLAVRSLDSGATFGFADGAVVWHDLKPGRMSDRLRDLPRRGGVVSVVKRHPELRDRFRSRWFLDPGHAYVLVAVAGLAVVARRPSDARRWALAAALAMPWARERGRYYPRRSWPRVLPQWLIVDLVDVGVMAAASARERTLFL
jgi:glycosyltransferase involved in cell wall biosynthesis